MALLKNSKNILCVLFMFSILISCNTSTETEMDHFITGKIHSIDIAEDPYGISLITENDTILSLGYKEDLKEYVNQLSQLQVGQEISIKGIRTCWGSWKLKEDRCLITIKKIKF